MDVIVLSRRIRVRLRTAASALALACVGVADYWGFVDVRPIVEVFVSDDRAVGAVVAALGIFFFAMRAISPMFVSSERLSGAEIDATYRGISQGE